jgi:hypothetical protein
MMVSLGVRKIETLLQRNKDLGQRVEVMEQYLRRRGKKKYFFTMAHFYGRYIHSIKKRVPLRSNDLKKG